MSGQADFAATTLLPDDLQRLYSIIVSIAAPVVMETDEYTDIRSLEELLSIPTPTVRRLKVYGSAAAGQEVVVEVTRRSTKVELSGEDLDIDEANAKVGELLEVIERRARYWPPVMVLYGLVVGLAALVGAARNLPTTVGTVVAVVLVSLAAYYLFPVWRGSRIYLTRPPNSGLDKDVVVAVVGGLLSGLVFYVLGQVSGH